MKLSNTIYYLGPALIMTIIFLLSHQPRVMDGLPPITGLDKLLHFAAYFVLAMSWIIAFSKNNISNLNLKTGILSLLYAFSDEFHQTFVPTRAFEVLDLVADGVGIFLALKFSHLVQRKLQAQV